MLPARKRLDNRAVSVQAQIEELLGADAPTLARLEETLTDGYAEALELETERLRIERRLGSLRDLLNALNQRARALRASS
jgi:hypothetical protein